MSSSYSLGDMFSLGISVNSTFAKLVSLDKSFSINFLDRSQMEAIELGGYLSNNTSIEKTQVSKLTFTHSNEIDAPYINEASLVLECITRNVIPFGETSLSIIASIKNRLCENFLLNEEGVFQYSKLDIPLYEGDSSKRVYRFMTDKHIDGGTFYKQMIRENKGK